MSWPPNPNSQDSNSQGDSKNTLITNNNATSSNVTSKEWQLIEKTMLASVEEQRRSRRWNIILNLLKLVFLVLMFVFLSRACTHDYQNPNGFEAISKNTPHLAVVDVQGAIAVNNAANAMNINVALSEAFANDKAKAVVLNINSPGGSPVQSDEVWQHMKDMKAEYPDKKLYAVIGDMGASGAYYIASAADEIYVNPSSLVGSIGVIMPNYDARELMKKVGVQDRTMTAGEYKDILSMGRDMTDFEKDHVDSVLANTHKHFIDAVKQGRGSKLKNPEENNLFTGLFWTGEQAIELGLADKSGGISKLEKDLEVDTTLNYTVINPVQSLFDSFALNMGTGIGNVLSETLLNEQQGKTELR